MSAGIPIRSTLDNSTTVQYSGLITSLTSKARSVVRDLDPQNDLTFLRVRSKKHELMIAPGRNHAWRRSLPLFHIQLLQSISLYHSHFIHIGQHILY